MFFSSAAASCVTYMCVYKEPVAAQGTRDLRSKHVYVYIYIRTRMRDVYCAKRLALSSRSRCEMRECKVQTYCCGEDSIRNCACGVCKSAQGGLVRGFMPIYWRVLGIRLFF